MKRIAIVTAVLLMAAVAFAAPDRPAGDAALGMAADYNLGRSFTLDSSFDFTGFTATGFQVYLVDPDPATGVVSSANGSWTLDASTSYTYADDFMVLFASADLSDILLQIGGFSDTGATYSYSWPNGASNVIGTIGGGLVSGIDVDVTGYYLWIGNGYSYASASGTWTGSFTLSGSVVENEDTSFSAVKALFR